MGGVCHVAAPAEAIYELLKDSDRRGEWDAMYEGHRHLQTYNRYYRTTHYSFQATGPVQGRDVVAFTGSRKHEDGGIDIISYSVEHGDAPPSKEYVRVHLHFAGFTLRPSVRGGTDVVYVSCVDLKGWLMSSIKNWVASQSTQNVGRIRDV